MLKLLNDMINYAVNLLHSYGIYRDEFEKFADMNGGDIDKLYDDDMDQTGASADLSEILGYEFSIKPYHNFGEMVEDKFANATMSDSDVYEYVEMLYKGAYDYNSFIEALEHLAGYEFDKQYLDEYDEPVAVLNDSQFKGRLKRALTDFLVFGEGYTRIAGKYIDEDLLYTGYGAYQDAYKIPNAESHELTFWNEVGFNL